jgi:DNA polymerase-3 subunit alpha
MSSFISLHNHSQYSILQALPSPKELFAKAKELGQEAIAISDYGNLSGVWDCYKASKDTGVKFIPGCELYFTNDLADKEEKLRQVVLLAKNAEGYKNLLRLHRAGFDRHSIIMKKVVPVIDWSLLKKYSEGLVCLTACGNGIVGQLINSKRFDEAEETLQKLIDIFGQNLGAEIQAHNAISSATHYRGAINQVFTNTHIIRLAKKLGIKIVPTCNTHYLSREDSETHDVELAIGSGQPVYSNARMKFNTTELYLKSEDEIKTFFSRNYGEDFAETICKNTKIISDMCEPSAWVDPKFSNPTGKELPTFPVSHQPDYKDFVAWTTKQLQENKVLEQDEDRNYLRFVCEKAFSIMVPKGKEIEYRARLERELDTFYFTGISSYMLIVADYVNWAKQNGVSCGPGRGSVAGSLVAFFLKIHAADPIKYGLVFERFYNKLKTGYSDIDCDFSQAGREKVIKYITAKYGKDNVAQISNINKVTPKVFIKDLARSLQMGGSRDSAVLLGNTVADYIPKEITSIEEAIKKCALFAESAKRNPDFIKHKKICNKPRAVSQHAAGLIIGTRALSDIVPVRTDKNGAAVVELDKDKSEEVGLVKMDILGLETLDVIDLTYDFIREQGKEVPVIDFEAYDEKTYDLISKGDTLCVFQFGTSAGTVELCRRIKPKSIEDLAIITTIARPASKDIREDLINVKNGKAKAKVMHPSLERAMKDTYGFSIYDESLLILSEDVSGWDLAEADKLRKLTKEKGKNPEKAKKWREEFIEGAIENKIDEKIAIRIWEEIVEPYGKYSFNKSHAVTYSFISYITAYLKAHFPLEFLLANLKFELQSNAPTAEENALKIKNELRKLGKKLMPPDVNASEISYKIQDDTTLVTGLEAAKFLGDDAMHDILSKRPFKSFDDFMLRVETKKVGAASIKALAAIGALDSFKIPRKMIYLYASDYREKLKAWLKTHNSKIEQFEYAWPAFDEWSRPELYALELKYLGESFICGKKVAYDNGRFYNGKSIPIRAIKKEKDKSILPHVKGEIKSIFEFKIKKETSRYVGQDMAKCVIEDEFGDQINITIFPDSLKEARRRIKDAFGSKHKLEPTMSIHFNGSVNLYEDEIGVIVRDLLNASPSPAVPEDLKAKKIVVKRLSKKEKIDIKKSDNVDDIISDLEDDLFNGGHIDLDQEEDETGDDYDI